MIGDDRQRLDRRPRQAALLRLLLAQQEGQIGRRAELPFSRNAGKVYAAMLIHALKLGHEPGDVRTLRQRCGQRLQVQRLARREQQRLGHAQMLGVHAHGLGGRRL